MRSRSEILGFSKILQISLCVWPRTAQNPPSAPPRSLFSPRARLLNEALDFRGARALQGGKIGPLSAHKVHFLLVQVFISSRCRRRSTTQPPHGTPQEQPAARSKALAPPEALAKDSRAKKHDAVTARRPTPPTAIGNTPPTPHTRLTSTRAPRPHGTPQGQPAARSEALASFEALAKDNRAKEHDAVKA